MVAFRVKFWSGKQGQLQEGGSIGQGSPRPKFFQKNCLPVIEKFQKYICIPMTTIKDWFKFGVRYAPTIIIICFVRYSQNSY